jgi:diadenosine tetraphosphate (Ap4A) HIT family hydrolase
LHAVVLASACARIAGAGVIDHVHLHVVPRWAGDTNFAPVLTNVKAFVERRSAGDAGAPSSMRQRVNG